MDTTSLIVTAHPEFLLTAISELKQLDQQCVLEDELAPGIALCKTSDATRLMRKAAEARPVFVRHLAPVQVTIPLTNTEQDPGSIATEIAQLPTLTMLERGTHFAVQTRFVQTDKNRSERPYSSGRLNQTLAEAFAEESGAVEEIKRPRVILSLLCSASTCYAGISPVEENLSNWPGGARHFAHITEQISRAEFKLLEALEVFEIELPSSGYALDLGAAPGGWTRLLLAAGLDVTAVDPAHLDPRLANHAQLRPYRGYAEQFLTEAVGKRVRFDAIVNDMRMDARDAARLLSQANRCLRPDAFVLSVFKLPHMTVNVDPLVNLKDALHILRKSYNIVQARQLFHNRQEVTVIAARPLLPSRS